MIAILGAMEEEIKELKHRMRVEKAYRFKKSWIYEGMFQSKKVLLVKTGVGKQKALEAIEHVFDKFSINTVISTGFGGALVDHLKIGDVVLYSSLSSTEGKENNLDLSTHTVPIYQKIVRLSQPGSGCRYLYGKGVTTGEICATPEARVRLFREYSSTVVDMESYWIARVALNWRIPCVVIRSISDLVQDDLTFLIGLFSRDRVSPKKLAGCLIRRPGMLRSLAYLYRNSRNARKSLTIAVKDLVTECLSE